MQEVDDHLERARYGDREYAFFGLLELREDPIPSLLEAYRIESEPNLRALIVEVVWQFRHPWTVGFLADALCDPHPETWKQALDGLVTLGTPDAKRALETALDSSVGHDTERRAWITEAIDQMSFLQTIDLAE